MDRILIGKFIKTKIFRFLLILAIIYFIGFILFLNNVEKNRVLVNHWVDLTDLVYVIYWRWWLDWIIIIGFISIYLLLFSVFRFLQKIIQKEHLANYIFPVLLMALNLVSMIVIDAAITYFADYFINGTWYSTEILVWGMTAQRLYHGFFFWFAPALLVVGLPIYRSLLEHNNTFFNSTKTFFIMLGCYSITLGLIDTTVCQIIWGDWAIFGEWNMMGYGWIWATGWISHYLIFGGLWFFAAWLIQKAFNEIEILNKKRDNL